MDTVAFRASYMVLVVFKNALTCKSIFALDGNYLPILSSGLSFIWHFLLTLDFCKS